MLGLIVGGFRKCCIGLLMLKYIRLMFMLVVNSMVVYDMKLNLGLVLLGLSWILLKLLVVISMRNMRKLVMVSM